MINSNVTPIRNKSQQLSQQKNIHHFCDDDKLKQYLESSLDVKVQVVNMVAWFNGRMLDCTLSQTTIGEKVKRSREQINRIMDELHDEGIIHKEAQRTIKDTCTYTAHPSLFGSLRRTFCKYMPSLQGLLLINLLSVANVTRLDINKDKDIFTSGRYTLISSNCQESPAGFKKDFLREERVRSYMLKKAYGDDPFGKAIRLVDEAIALTDYGKIKLCPFPDMVIMQALKELLASPVVIKDPVLWLFKYCVRLCKADNIRPNWQWYEQLARDFHMPKDQNLALTVTGRPFMSVQAAVQKKKEPRIYSSKGTTEPAGAAYVPFKPVIRPELDIVEEYLKFERHRLSDEGKSLELALGMKLSNPFLNRILDLKLPAEEYERLGIIKGGEVCRSSISSPASPVQSSKVPISSEKSGHHLPSSERFGISMQKTSMEITLPSIGQSTSISPFSAVNQDALKSDESSMISKSQLMSKNHSPGVPVSQTLSSLLTKISPKRSLST